MSLRPRATLGRLLKRIRRPVAPTILMYHRVAELAVDPWQLAVTPLQFEQQMRWLRRHRAPMPLDEMVRRLAAETLPGNAVAVTFDDGYVDNLAAAKPVLLRHGIPATLFVATGSIGQPEEFWWDELARLVVAGRNGASGEIVIGAEVFDFPPSRNVGSAEGSLSGENLRLYRQLWAALRAAPAPLVRSGLARLREFFHAGGRAEHDRAMTEAELRVWLDGGLTTIAPHTVTHRPMSQLTAGECRDELASSIARCEAIAGRTAIGFAYPYGDRSEDVAAAVRAAGLQYACSTRGAAISDGRNADFFDLPRIHVTNSPLAGQWRE